ncbi:prolipoprotein diacylglyceryl transferase [Candidatus Roizmanbacteria bacterium]|nr:MAG: prolipoprotein diacylglyceryl transferase [Candidatus Roizmanbacteria bacterium]
MLPVLLDLGFFKLYTFGIFLVLAFFWGTFFLWKNITLTSYKEDEIFDGVFFALLGGIFVGRIQFVALHFSEFGYDILKFLLLNGYPGIGLLGFLAGFFLFFLIFASWRKINFMRAIDYFIAPFFLAMAIAKLGAFFSGSEIGTQTKFFLALSYQNLDGARHLTALYETLAYFAASFFAYKIVRSIRRGSLYEGFNFVFFVWYVALVTVVFDNLKAFRVSVRDMSFDLVVGSLLLLTVSLYFIYYFRQSIWMSVKRIFSSKKKKK